MRTRQEILDFPGTGREWLHLHSSAVFSERPEAVHALTDMALPDCRAEGARSRIIIAAEIYRSPLEALIL